MSLQDDETSLKKDADSLLDQELTAPNVMLSACSQNDMTSNGKRKKLVSNIIDEKKEVDCPRDAGGQTLSPYELYCLSKIEHNHFDLMIIVCSRKKQCAKEESIAKEGNKKKGGKNARPR